MDVKNIRIAIYGAGAMGTTLGAMLVKGGLSNVDFINRNRAYVENLKNNGAIVNCIAENKQIKIKVNAYTPEEMHGRYDVIFLMTKQRYNEEIATNLLPYLKDDSVLCTTQNGLPEPLIANIIGNERTYGAVVSFGANFTQDGMAVEMTSKTSAMQFQIGGYQNDGAKLSVLKEILSYAAIATDNQANENFIEITDDLIGARWSKLTINAAFSGLSVMTGMPFGEIARKHKTRKLALAVIRECIDVATAQGVTFAKMQGKDMAKILGGKTPIKRFIAYMVLPFVIKKHKKLVSGMLKDVEKGRKCEIDYINGVVCKEGEKTGVETPLCQQIVEIVHGVENGLYEMDYKNVDFF